MLKQIRSEKRETKMHEKTYTQYWGFWNWDWKPKKDLSFLTFSWISRSTTSLPLVCPMEGKEVRVNKVRLLVYFSNVDFPAVDFGFMFS